MLKFVNKFYCYGKLVVSSVRPLENTQTLFPELLLLVIS